MFIKTDKSAELFYREHLAESEKLQDAVNEGAGHHYAFEDISQDIFSMLFERNPQDEDAPTPAGLRICKQALDQIKELREYQELHRLTQMDPLASGIATVSMDKAFMGFVPKMPDSPEQLKQKAECAKELGMDKQAEKLEADSGKAQALLDKIQNRVLDGEACRQKVRTALQGALEETRDAMEGMSAFGHGDEDGQLKQSGLKEKLELSKKLRDSKKLKDIAKLAGRFTAIAKKKQREKMVSNEISSVKMGSFIPRVLPSELAKLSTPALAPLFYKGYVENTLLEYDLHAKKPMGQGPIIYIMDGSGSMGEGCFPELAAKGIGMALFEIAKRQKRDFILAQFGNANQYRELVITADSKVEVDDGKGGKVTKPYNALYIMSELEFFFNGGTDFQRPLTEAIAHIGGHKFNKADIIFATDGCANLTPEFVEAYQKVKGEKKFSCIGILVAPGTSDAKDAPEVMKQFCDELFPVDNLLEDNDANDNLHETMFKI